MTISIILYYWKKISVILTNTKITFDLIKITVIYFIGKSLSAEVTTVVENFYLRDDVSSTMPGMKDVTAVRDENGVKQHLQKKLLLLNLRELYQAFKEEHSEINIGFTKFSVLRPANCILAGSSGTHSVCVCAYHQNVKLLLIGKFKSLYIIITD